MHAKHAKFLQSLAELQYADGVDLMLIPGDDRGYVQLCVVSDGIFTPMCTTDSLEDSYAIFESSEYRVGSRIDSR